MARPRKKPQAERATPAIVGLRVQAILQIRLDGAEAWDVLAHVADKQLLNEQPWAVEPGDKGLCERQVRNYIAAADKAIAETCRISRKQKLHRHKAQRRNLYARAVNAGAIRDALAVLDSLARLEDLFPSEKIKVQHRGGVKMELVHEIVTEHPSLSLPAPEEEPHANGHANGTANGSARH